MLIGSFHYTIWNKEYIVTQDERPFLEASSDKSFDDAKNKLIRIYSNRIRKYEALLESYKLMQRELKGLDKEQSYKNMDYVFGCFNKTDNLLVKNVEEIKSVDDLIL